MEIKFRIAGKEELHEALSLLKQAAEMLKGKKVNQWTFWIDPPQERINWVKEGFENGEFYFVEAENNKLAGMFRLMMQDELYWGKQADEARYVHSLVVTGTFSGKGLGKLIMQRIEQSLVDEQIKILRLDCNASNPVLCGYYEKQGFNKVGEKQMLHSLNNLYEKLLYQSS